MTNLEIVNYLNACGINSEIASGECVKMDDSVYCPADEFVMLDYYYLNGKRISGESIAYDGDAYFNARVFVKGIGQV